MVQVAKKTRKRRNRDETERRLIDVALDLIRKNGVLAGLNLRVVAEGARVNRGNIYHYFGSRQELLRAAINRRFEAVVDRTPAGMRGIPFVRRALLTFRGPDGTNETRYDSKLRALLVLDGDDSVDPMPRYEGALDLLRQNVTDGDIDRAHDLEALQVAFVALTRGYHIFRIPFAKRTGIDAAELDVSHGATTRGQPGRRQTDKVARVEISPFSRGKEGGVRPARLPDQPG
jgi:AcrR family transcriptional regulator